MSKKKIPPGLEHYLEHEIESLIAEDNSRAPFHDRLAYWLEWPGQRESLEKTITEKWCRLSKKERYTFLARHEAQRLWRQFPNLPKHSLNEPSDCLSSRVKDRLKERYGVEYSKKHIAERFLNDLIRPPK
jgi:hypothetical protein